MSRTVADGLWEMLVGAGVRRCYGIVGDALNPVIDALRRNGQVDFVHVRNEEFGVFAAVAEAMGAKGIRVEEPGDLVQGLAAAPAHTGGPVVVDVVVDPYAVAIPAHVPARTAAGFTLSATRQVLAGRLDDVIDTTAYNARLI
ncbi:thiamine pyrophosphate-binding protein [Streptomyces sp. NPDC059627]